MQETISDSGCKRLYQTADAGVSLSDSGCWSLSIRDPMQQTLYQTVDARVSILETGCKRGVEGTGMQRSCLE